MLAIKQTLYRTGADSPIVDCPGRRGAAGKEVTVVIELLARFDEEANLNWAAQLEAVGAHVVYGVVGYKTHAKMMLVVRREDGKAACATCTSAPATTTHATARAVHRLRPVHRQPAIGEDVHEVFMQLTEPGQAEAAHAGSRRSRCTSAWCPRSATRRRRRLPASRRASSPR